MITDDDFRKAWDRIARTADGVTAYLHLQKRLMAVAATNDPSALLRCEGERSFAAHLIGLMSKGIEQSVGSEPRPITFAVAGARPVGRPGSRRLVSADTPVAGWDAESGTGEAS